MPDVRYSGESVGFHWYDTSADDVAFLKRTYPMFMTETSPGPPATDDLAALQNCERVGISWVHLEGKSSDLTKLRAMVRRLHETGFGWDADPDATGTGGATRPSEAARAAITATPAAQ
jgi:hypothetical protein